MSAQPSPEEVVRKFFDCYTNSSPQDFDECVAPDYVDYGHEPPGIGPAGARDDYENAIKVAGGPITYTIDALVAGDGTLAVVWRHFSRTEPVPGRRRPAPVDAAHADRRHTPITCGIPLAGWRSILLAG
jgi:hypothetical protein